LLAHVTHPDEESEEADHDQQLIEPGTHPVHDLKYYLKTVCNKMPESVHGFYFLDVAKIEILLNGEKLFFYF
jgi:hypothetical protein